MWGLFDGKDIPDLGDDSFFQELRNAATGIGFPCFLRTGMTSGKHEWKNTCYVESASDVPQHVFNIVEFSECADIFGMDWSVWAVRELLPTIPHGVCPRYGNMPVCREFRFFVEDGQIHCFHPYWPLEALKDGGWSGDYEAMCAVPDEVELRRLAERVSWVVPGAWSVDILETERGWYVTDMAEAYKSFHWEGCPNANRS
jgi:hypothetical protein